MTDTPHPAVGSVMAWEDFKRQQAHRLAQDAITRRRQLEDYRTRRYNLLSLLPIAIWFAERGGAEAFDRFARGLDRDH